MNGDYSTDVSPCCNPGIPKGSSKTDQKRALPSSGKRAVAVKVQQERGPKEGSCYGWQCAKMNVCATRANVVVVVVIDVYR